MSTIVIMGLGNPGSAYAATRHNVGFRCVDHYARIKGVRFVRTACHSRLATFRAEESDVVLAKPRTFMNLSGRAAAALVHSYRIPIEALVVVYDDVDLPLGRLRVRPSGGTGGHNGVKSIVATLGVDHFPRVRVGIGRPDRGDSGLSSDGELVDYVLGRFLPDEEEAVCAAVARVSDVLDSIVQDGVEAAMNRFNSVV
jgi:PTH1 family peptidyl-tRNA hydrolase